MTIRVLHGDCRDVLPTLAANSVHCVVTSPPYYGLRDYGVAGQLGLEATPDEYIQTMVAVFRLIRRVLRDDGTVWCNMGDSFADKQLLMMPARLALALQADGWWLRSDIIWAKPNPMPESVTDRPTSAHEHVFMLTKSARYAYDADAVREERTQDEDARTFRGDCYVLGEPSKRGIVGNDRVALSAGRNLRNVWTIATHSFPDAHFATFPPALAETCIKAGTSERGCCAACGAPWVRQVERETLFLSGSGRAGNLPEGKGRPGDGQIREGHDIRMGNTSSVTTTGWSPGCRCDAPTQPCIVLDPFAGAGTTMLVADRLQRHAIGIELNEAYAMMARNRIVADAPLFAEVAD